MKSLPAASLLLIAPMLQAQVRYYHYSLATASGEPSYEGEVTGSQQRYYDYYAVARDPSGHLESVSYWRAGKLVGTTRYHYPKGGARYDGFRNFSGETETGSVQVARDAQHRIVRYEYFTVDGKPTGRTTIDRLPDRNDERSYSAEGKETSHGWSFFNAQGVLVKTTNLVDSGRSTETDISPTSGWNLATRQFRDGQLTLRTEYRYDGDGQLVRRDAYKQGDAIYASIFYTNDLETRRAYYLDDHSIGKELRSFYDAKEDLERVELSYRGHPVCTLTYDRLPDGTVTRTLAKGPDGSLWAEYPDHRVRDVESNGAPVGFAGGNILKQGKWLGD